MAQQDYLTDLRRDGFCIIPDVLTEDDVGHVRERLWSAVADTDRRGIANRDLAVDANEHNIRLANLIDFDQAFRDLIMHPAAIEAVQDLIGEYFTISNFSANIALPGARSMKIHSDLALVVPEPWTAPWSVNIAWCLDDIHSGNGATRVVPGSHAVTRKADLPDDLEARMVSLTARKGSMLVIDGRTWHTSGSNSTTAEQRAMLFGYYALDFLRPQQNWISTLSEETKASLSDELAHKLGLRDRGNLRMVKPLLFDKRPKAVTQELQ